MLQTNWWTCRQGLSAAVLQTNFVCTGSPDRQTLQTTFVFRKSAKMQTNIADKSCRQTLSAENPPKPGQNADKYCRQILKTNLVCRKSAENWAKMQTNPADKLCQQFLLTKFVCTGNLDRQTLQTNLVCRKSAENWPKCRQILQTNLVKTNYCRQLRKSADKVCAPSLDKVCLS